MIDFGVLKIMWKVFWYLVEASHTVHSGQDLRNKFYKEDGLLVFGGRSGKPQVQTGRPGTHLGEDTT